MIGCQPTSNSDISGGIIPNTSVYIASTSGSIQMKIY